MKTLMTTKYAKYNQDTNLDNTYATLNTANYDTDTETENYETEAGTDTI